MTKTKFPERKCSSFNLYVRWCLSSRSGSVERINIQDIACRLWWSMGSILGQTLYHFVSHTVHLLKEWRHLRNWFCNSFVHYFRRASTLALCVAKRAGHSTECTFVVQNVIWVHIHFRLDALVARVFQIGARVCPHACSSSTAWSCKVSRC
jgi:hypothetical protein